jgi:putative ABC transport system substrate-binding protein
MLRREFLTLVGSAAAWPLAARAQQGKMPTIGILSPSTREREGDLLEAFTRSLRQAGYVDGQNIAVEHRFADDRFDRLPALASDLVRRDVAVIVTLAGTIAALAAKSVTQTIPIVFITGGDPVKARLVASLNRPGGNVTGINLLSGSLNEKRLQLLHEVVPRAKVTAALGNPNNPNQDSETRSLDGAARLLGVQLRHFEASNATEIQSAFAAMTGQRIEALIVNTDPFLNARVDDLVALVARLSVPAVFGYRNFAAAGGLMSYGTSPHDARRQAALLVARILQGEKPAELPVQRATKVELVINLKTAKTLGLSFPLALLGRADEVIE